MSGPNAILSFRFFSFPEARSYLQVGRVFAFFLHFVSVGPAANLLTIIPLTVLYSLRDTCLWTQPPADGTPRHHGTSSTPPPPPPPPPDTAMLFFGSSTTQRLAKSASLLSQACASQPASATRVIVRLKQTSVKRSHVGSLPVYLPSDVQLEELPFPPLKNPSLQPSAAIRKSKGLLIKGPKGEMPIPLLPYLKYQVDQPEEEGEQRKVTFELTNDEMKRYRGYWGLSRCLLANAVTGVTEGHSYVLRLVGVGYRASVEDDPIPRKTAIQIATEKKRIFFLNAEQKAWELEREARMIEEASKSPRKRLNIRLGYSHPVLMPVPDGITAEVPQPNRIVLRGVDKEQLGNFAAAIRKWRPPEPYKVSRPASSIYAPLLSLLSILLTFVAFHSHRVRACLSATRRSASRTSRRSKSRETRACQRNTPAQFL